MDASRLRRWDIYNRQKKLSLIGMASIKPQFFYFFVHNPHYYFIYRYAIIAPSILGKYRIVNEHDPANTYQLSGHITAEGGLNLNLTITCTVFVN